MRTTTIKLDTRTIRRALTALTAGLALFAATERAQAQEILLTGPLAGAPPVRKLRLYREGRIEVAPAVSFTLLDEFRRTILVGGRVNYNITDWLAIGAWGAYGLGQLDTSLTDEIQGVNRSRGARNPAAPTVDDRLTARQLGRDFSDQVAKVEWMVAPQLTAVPFRGKIALFQSFYVDTDFYVFAGPAFVGVQDRGDCVGNRCIRNDGYARVDMKSRTAIAPTFGLGFTFYTNKWSAIGFEYRAVPYAVNLSGFDTGGSGEGSAFPDNNISAADRKFRFNQMLTVSWNFYLPMEYRLSE